MEVAVLRRTSLLSAGVLLLLLGAVSASGRSAADDPFVGTWSVKNVPGQNQNTPWKNGGTITITAATQAQVMPYDGNGQITTYCVRNVTVRGWYLVSYAWANGQQGTMGGCNSSATGSQTHGVIRFTGKVGGDWGGGTVEAASPTSCSPTAQTCLAGTWYGPTVGYFVAGPSKEPTTKTVSGPAPGASRSVESPSVPAGSGAQRGDVEVELGAEGDDGYWRWTATAGEGDLRKTDAEGLVFWCWLDYDFKDKTGRPVQLSAVQQLFACVQLTVDLLRHGKLGSPQPAVSRSSSAISMPSVTAGAGCKTKAIPIRLRKRGKKLVVAGRAKANLPAGSTRYACSFSGGTAKLTVTAPHGLRKAVGKTLSLSVYRQKKAPRASRKLRVTFGW